MAKIAVTKERRDGETRVAAVPETVAKLVEAGAAVAVERGAGLAASFPDAQYEAAGATLAADARAAVAGADVLLKVRAPSKDEIAALCSRAIVVGLLNPHQDLTVLAELAHARATAFAMEFIPRTTRAQAMDALSSQANLAGYRAVIEAAHVYGRILPMMTTAAGSIAPAKVFVIGAGVAGLQAIATARRLGAVVTASDVRPPAKEQVQSLGAKFIAVEDEEFKAAETAGGYAKSMSAEYRAKQTELVTEHIRKQDIVITTALVPGRSAPRLVSAAQVASMRPGSVLIDLAVEQGGNVEGARPDEIVERGGVKIVGWTNLAGRVAADASALYARNILAFVGLVLKSGNLALNLEDEILKAALVTHDGAVVHPALVQRAPAA
jgi:H+-translocating NAD(P) transhydrogenase subunit alpha